MHRAAIEDLFEYTGWTWDQVVGVIEGSGGDELLLRHAPGSGWPALRDCLAHIIFGYDRWLGFIQDTPRETFDRAAAHSLAVIGREHARLRDEFRTLLAASTEQQLAEVRPFRIYDEMLPYSRGELMAHLLLHDRGHHGDVTTLFYQLGVEFEEPLEYRFYVSAKR